MGLPAITPAMRSIRSTTAVGLGLELRGAVDDQIRRRPLLVEHAERDLAEALDRLRLGARAHRGDEQIVAVAHVVDERLSGAVLLAVRSRTRRCGARARTRAALLDSCGNSRNVRVQVVRRGIEQALGVFERERRGAGVHRRLRARLAGVRGALLPASAASTNESTTAATCASTISLSNGSRPVRRWNSGATAKRCVAAPSNR